MRPIAPLLSHVCLIIFDEWLMSGDTITFEYLMYHFADPIAHLLNLANKQHVESELFVFFAPPTITAELVTFAISAHYGDKEMIYKKLMFIHIQKISVPIIAR